MFLKLSMIKLFKPILRLAVVVSIILTVCGIYNHGFDHNNMFAVIIVLLIPVLPTTYLFVEYYIASKNQTIEITPDYINVSHSNMINAQFLIKDISAIKLYKSAGAEKGNFPFQTAEMYYHAEVITKDNKKIILTSVLTPAIDEALELLNHNIKIEIIRTAYSTIYW